MASIHRSVDVPLPSRLSFARDQVHRRFADLIARYMPFDLVIDEETADGQEARVSKTSVCGSWGAIAGTLRYFADRFGVPRASIEGTQIPMDLVRRHAQRGEAELVYEPQRKNAPFALRRVVRYFGFELEREVEALDVFPPELAPRARRLLAEALARSEARHPAVHRNRAEIEEIREIWRRSGGTTPRLGFGELADRYERALGSAGSIDAFRRATLDLDLGGLVSDEERARYGALADSVLVRDREIEIDYDVEEIDGRAAGVARLRLPEKLARTLSEPELPELDRPLRFVVPRGQRGSVRAASLEELQALLDLPWTPSEVAREERRGGQRGERRRQPQGRGERGGRRETGGRRDGRGEGRGVRPPGKAGGGRGRGRRGR